ncbi:MAG: YraN family protein [Phycisphaerales bacterium]|nr:YraN family protein [Phycisphaerales bacterium]MCI0630987.1 YraN family protein [Phycisphaerales bacterium]MCI0676769.1 YraN family protein [Phycisphaerales bacterium]
MKWLPRFLWRRESLGRQGEKFAAKWLRRRRYRILERNVPIGDDEADLVALDPDGRTIVIVEVKTKRDDTIAPELSITQAKQFHLMRLASRLQQTRRYANRPFRFDALAVIWPLDGKPTVRHHVGAFRARW